MNDDIKITEHSINFVGVQNDGRGGISMTVSSDMKEVEAIFVLKHMFPSYNVYPTNNNGEYLITGANKEKQERKEEGKMNLIKEMEQNKLIAEKE